MKVYTIKGMGEERKLMIDTTQTVLFGSGAEPFEKYNGKIYNSKEEVDKAISELILDYNLKYIGEFNSYEDAQEELTKDTQPVSFDLADMVFCSVRNKIKSGDINKIIEKQIEKMVEEALSSALCGYSDECCSRVISGKLKEVMNKAIEEYNFNDYIVKFTDLMDKVIKNSSISQYKRLINNIGIQLEDVAKSVNLSDLFEEYCKMIEKEVTVSYNSDFDIEEGSTYMEVEMKKDDETGEYVFKFTDEFIEKDEELEEYTTKISIGTDYEGNKVITNVTGDQRFIMFGWLNSLKHANEFQILLMKLQQNMSHIVIDTTEECEEVTIQAEY